MNPSMEDRTSPFPESDDPKFARDSTISSMTTEEGGTEVALLGHFYRYSSQSLLDPTDIALQLAPDWVVRGYRLTAIQSPLRTTPLSIQMILRSTKLCACARSIL